MTIWRAARKAHLRRALAVCALALVQCGKSKPTAPAPSASSPPVTASRGTPCGAMGCAQYDDLAAALADALATKPLVVGFGEAHAQRGKEGVASSAKHFTEEVIPLLAPRASDLVVELMTPARRPDGSSCTAVAAAVAEKQKIVTAPQAAGNQSEYLVMGEAARKLGVVPDLLRPTCEDLAAIDAAGDDMIATSLETIARLTTAKVTHLLERNTATPADREKMVVTYGGALHNDLKPTAERARWTYGPALSQRTGGRYVEIDLYIADFVEDTDAWKKQAFYAHYDREKLGAKITMFRPNDGSFVILLPRGGTAR